MGRIACLAVFLLPAVVNARPLARDGFAQTFDVVATRPDARGTVFARQVLPPARPTSLARPPTHGGPQSATTAAPQRAQSRVIYVNPWGVVLRPGDNDSSKNTSSVVEAPVVIDTWDTDWNTWEATRDCVQELFAPFDVRITDEDPGDVPHVEAVLGGSPRDVGLPDNVGGVSPFTTDCAVIERSIVFAFTEVLPDDARTVCEVIAQEIAHSFGLDHEMLPSDPMTYLDYAGDRQFQDQMAACGEFGGRMCGINGSVCRPRQNSYALLLERLGPNPSAGREDKAEDDTGLAGGVTGGCAAAGGGGGEAGIVVLVCYVVGHRVCRRRARDRRHRPLL